MNAPEKIYLPTRDGQSDSIWNDHWTHGKDVEFIRADIREAEIDALKAENAESHAECDRLTAMLGPQMVLSAEEVTVPGFYWHRYGTEEWCVVDVDFGYPYGRLFIWANGEQDDGLEGQFIGPLKTPEV